ncbi:MAG: helix-turn-helix domain-containing protein [Patescibacteria group bacterium]
MATNLEALLVGAQLSGVEAKIYLTTLEMGSASLTDIAKRSGVSKTSTYEVLEALRQRKVVRVSRRGKRGVYSAADPERLVEVLRGEAAEQAMTIDDVVRALPLFTALQGGTRPSVMIHEGADAVYGYFEHLAKIKPESMDEISNVDDIYSWVEKETLLHARKMYPWIPKKSRVLYTGTPRNPRKGFELRVLNKQWGTFHGNIAMYGNFVSLVTFTSTPTVIVIESKPLAESLRLLFTIAWRASDEPKDLP